MFSAIFSSSLAALSAVNPPTEISNPGPAQQVVIQKSLSLKELRAEASTKTVVSGDELKQFADTSVISVLQRQPGVNLLNGQISLRGLPVSYTQILINGEAAPPGFSLDSVNPAALERIEIATGGRVDQSAQAIAGSINLIFKTNSANLPQLSQFQVQRGASQDSLNLTHDLNAQLAGLEYGLRLQVQENRYQLPELSHEQEYANATGQTSLYRSSQDYVVGQTRRWSLQPRLQAKTAAHQSWQIQVWLEQSRNHAQGWGSETTKLGKANDYPENSFASTTELFQGRLEMQWKQRLSADWRMQNKLSFWHSNRDIDYQFLGQPATSDQQFKRQVVSNANEKKWQQSTQFNWSFESQHSLALGWSLAQTQRSEQRLQSDSWSGRSSAARSGPGLASYLDEAYQAKINNLAAFVQDEWDFRDNWRSYLGLRWESLSTAVDSRASLQQEGLIKTRAAVWSPVINLLWRNPEATAQQLTQQWRFALGRSYKAPEPRQIIPRRYTVNNGNNPANADFAGNPELLPELAWNADLAYEYSWASGTWLGLSAYSKRIQNVVVDELIQYQQRWLLHPVNLPAATARGFELELRLPLNLTLWQGKWAMRVHAGYHQSQLAGAKWQVARLPGQLPYSWNYQLDYQGGRHQVNLNWQVQGGGWSQNNALLSSYQNQSNKFELAWHYRLAPQLKLSLVHSQSLRATGVQESVYRDQQNSLLRSRYSPADRLSRLQIEFSN